MAQRVWHRTAVAAVTAGILAISGCGAGDDSGNDSGEDGGKVSITLNWWGGDKRIQLTQQAVAAFEKEHPNIHVDMQYADWGGYWDKLATSIAGGDAPDVIQMDDKYLAAYSSQGSLLDLSTVSEKLKLDGMDQSVADLGKYDGTQYAVPISITPAGIIVNDDLLKEIGVEKPDDTKNWTWDAFAEFDRQIIEKSGGKVRGSDIFVAGYGLNLYARQHGEELFDGKTITISPAVLTDFFTREKSFIDQGLVGSADQWAAGFSSTLEQGPFATHETPLTMTQAPMITAHASAAGTDNLSLMIMPSDSNSKWMYMKPGMYWAISSKTKHPAECAELIDFLVNSTEAGSIIGTERGIPANNKVRELAKQSASELDKKVFDYIDRITPILGVAPPLTPNGASNIDGVVARYAQAVAFGQQTPADAANAMIAEIKSEIEGAK